jgi:hypothetical protein
MRIGPLLGSILIPGAQGMLAERPFVQPIRVFTSAKRAS